MSVVTITPEAGTDGVLVSFVYDADLVEAFKAAVPHTARRWRAADRVWWVATAAMPALTAALENTGHQVHNNRPRGPQRSDIRRDTWADVMFEAVGPHRADAVHRALTRVLHPDTPAGDTALMQALNTARDRLAVAHR